MLAPPLPHSFDSGITMPSVGFSALGGAFNTTVAGATATWPTANLAIAVPFRLYSPLLLKQLWWFNGTKSGTPNLDCGIYGGPGLNLLRSTGSTAQGASTTFQAVDVTDITLDAGIYYMALSCDSNATGVFRIAPTAIAAPLGAFGVLQMASALPLPNPFVGASAANIYVPIFGYTGSTVF